MSASHAPLRIAATGGEPELLRWLALCGDIPGVKTNGIVPISDLSPGSFSAADIWLIGGYPESRFFVASEAVRSSCHAFLAWPISGSSDACLSLARLADEAGVEVGIDRPFWGSPLLDDIPARGSASLSTISCSTKLYTAFDDLVDLCHLLSGNSPTRQVWATKTEDGSSQVGLRFQSGLFSVITLRNDSSLPDTIFFAGNEFAREGRIERNRLSPWQGSPDTDGAPALVHFVSALRDRKRVSLSISDAVETLRTIEAINEQFGDHA